MIWITGGVLGAVTGALTAKKRKGNTADMAQYATGFGLCFALIGFVLTIVVEKTVF